MTREEYNEYKALCRKCDEGGNDGADVYEAEEYCRYLEEVHGKPFREQLKEFEPHREI